MEHIKTTVATDDENDIALERCDCGQYSLTIGPVTVQVDGVVVEALAKLLHAAVREADAEPEDPNVPVTSDVQ